ncbi:MAG: DUF3426 domain-containing protein [Gammaproteobacteria bacterium]|nr:DUF3426 domain-containing protein [Gammaproteobacteria bacterium]
MFTECPNCHTAFRVSTAQLKIAGGRARCGRCDSVFNAVEYLMDDIPGRSAAAGQTDYLSNLEDAAPVEEALSDVDIPGMDNVDFGDDGSGMEDLASAPVDMVDEDLFSTPAVADVEGELLADGLDGDELAEGFEGIDLDGDLSSPELDGGQLDAVLNEDDELALDVASGIGMDDLGVDLDAPEDPDAFNGNLDLADDDDTNRPSKGRRDDLLEEDSVDFNLDTELTEVASEASEFIDRRGSATDFVMRELGEKSSASGAFMTFTWSLIIVVLLLVLVGQFVYYKREDLVRYPLARQAMEQICHYISEYMACDVPEPRDLAAIELLERDVRSHPTSKGALLISATIRSSAEFVQPYPKLVLSFSDINQKTIARRVFQPKEYLRDDVDLEKGMEPDFPIRVVLEIVDPGSEAVNFEFEFE